MEVKDLYCYQCSQEFDKKCIFNDHLSDVHGIVFAVKRVPDCQPSNISYSFVGNTQNKKTEEQSFWLVSQACAFFPDLGK